MKRLSTVQSDQLTEVVCQYADFIGLDTNNDEIYQDIEDLVGELLEALYEKAEGSDVSS